MGAAMIKYSSSILITRISLLCLAVGFAAIALAPAAQSQQSVIYSGIANDISADTGERSFWDEIPLPASEVRLIIFEADDPKGGGSATAFDALAIVPELNATYEYRLCGERVLRVWSEDLWITWTPWVWSPGGKKIDPDEYTTRQISKFSDFVSHAKRTDRVLGLTRDPATLFHARPDFKAERIAQLRQAAMEFFRKSLRIEVANFSEATNQINTVIPATGEMVTFSVIRECSKDDDVEVGKVYPLRSVRPDLWKKIEANSTTLLVK
jgi:hypothetical protein